MGRAKRATSSGRWSIRKESPTPSELAALKQVIREIAKNSGAGSDAQRAALAQLNEAISQFRAHYPYLSEGRKTRGSIAEQREKLDVLSRALCTALEAAKSLPLDARFTFTQRIGSPIGKVTRLLRDWGEAASTEYERAQRTGDRPADDAPALLACDVARVLQGTLQARVTMTSDRNASGARGGGAYCRLLRATMIAAGGDPGDDLAPVMREGKRLFESLWPDAE